MRTRLQQNPANNVLVVGCVGDLDSACAEDFLAELTTAVCRHSCRLIVDLSSVEFIDSSGLHVIVATARRAASLGGWVRLVAPLSIVWQLLSSTTIHHALPVYPSVQKASRDPG